MQRGTRMPRWRWGGWIALVVIVLVLAGGAVWWTGGPRSAPAQAWGRPAAGADLPAPQPDGRLGVRPSSDEAGGAGPSALASAPQGEMSSQAPPPDATPTPVPSSENCVTCHTDKERLKELAEEPEKPKSEMTSGEG